MREKSFRVNNILNFKDVFSLRLSASARDIVVKNKNDGSLVTTPARCRVAIGETQPLKPESNSGAIRCY